MEDVRHWYEKVTTLVQDGIADIQSGVFGVGFLGLAVALRRVRAFKKFRKPSDVPGRFISHHKALKGRIVDIQRQKRMGNPLLMLDHFPMLGSRFRSQGELPVEICSVNVNQSGVAWMQHVAVKKPVTCTLMGRNEQRVTAIVNVGGEDLGQSLVAMGLGTVAPLDLFLDSDRTYLRYYQALLTAEASNLTELRPSSTKPSVRLR